MSKQQVPAENYAFCTINPSVAKVPVPDERFDDQVERYKPTKSIPAVQTIHDIAGQVRGASEGRGLGNEFLSHISSVDAQFHVCRSFKDKKVEHVENSVDPIRDQEIVSTEQIQKDQKQITRQYDDMDKIIRRGIQKTKKIQQQYDTLKKQKEYLEEGKDVRECEWNSTEIEFINTLQLLTAKPVIYLINLSIKHFESGSSKYTDPIIEWINKRSPNSVAIPFSVKWELDNQDNDTTNDITKLNTTTNSRIPDIITAGYKGQHLLHYFTCGPDEVRAWTIRSGTLAPQAAGVIHSDFEKFFIMAEIFNYNDLVKYKTEAEVKKNGKLSQRGKDYEMKDGDIAFFKHNAGGAGRKK